LPPPEDAANAAGRAVRRMDALRGLDAERLELGVVVMKDDLLDAAFLGFAIDHAPIREPLDRETRSAVEHGVLVEQAREEPARFGEEVASQERRLGFGARGLLTLEKLKALLLDSLLIMNVRRHAEPSDDAAVPVELGRDIEQMPPITTVGRANASLAAH